MSEEFNREERIEELERFFKRINKPFIITKCIRQKVVQEEIVDAYRSPVPSAVTTPNGVRQVEIGDWVAIHADGSRTAYKPEEFDKIFEKVEKVVQKEKPKPKEKVDV